MRDRPRPTFHELMVFILPIGATFAVVLGFIAFVVVRYL